MRVDTDRSRNGRFVFTGSQQFGMIRNLGDSLAGRIALLDLLPFAAAEMQQTAPAKGGLELFATACLTGAYPQLAVSPEIDRRLWYSSYIQTYLERDIRSLYDIGSLREFHRFMQLLAVRCSQMLNMSSFATDLGVSVTTIKRWLSVLEAGRVIFLLPPHFNNLGKRIKLSRTPAATMTSGLTRYSSLFAKADPEDGLLLCLADGKRQICRGVTAIGVEEYLQMLLQRLTP
jgi:predicted AAA+ superfamily ATPase